MFERRAPWFLVVVCWAGWSVPAGAQDQPITLSVVSTNDVHGRMSQLPLLGGFVRNLREARARDGGAVLLLDAGDIFQGTIESNSNEGAAMVRAFAALAYDAAALGNHEFDFGPAGPHSVPLAPKDDPLGALKARVAQAPFAFLNANLHMTDGKPLPIPKLKPSVMLTRRGVRIGIVGAVTANLLRTTHPGNTQGIVVVPLAAAIGARAAELRKQGARVVIALIHAGGECRDLRAHDDISSCATDSEAFDLARALPPGSVDLIIGGHTHAGVSQRVNGVPIIEAFSNGRAFGRADIRVPEKASEPIRVELYVPEGLCVEDLDKPSCAVDRSYEGKPVQRDARVAAAIAEDLRRAKAARAKPIGLTVTAPVNRAGPVESPLNNLIADLMLRASPGADATFCNAGAVRIPLPVGPLSYGTVFEMFPFDNAFATLRITARQFANLIVRNLSMSNGILALGGVTAAASCEEGKIAVQLFDKQGVRIEPDRLMTVVTSDFLASAGDGVLIGQNIEPGAITIQRDRPIRDALLEGLSSWPGGKLDGSDKSLFDPEHPRVWYPGPRPVSCAQRQ